MLKNTLADIHSNHSARTQSKYKVSLPCIKKLWRNNTEEIDNRTLDVVFKVLLV